MITLHFVTMSKDGIRDSGTPLLPPSTLTTTPSVTVPLVTDIEADAHPIWEHLRPPADFFDIPLPSVDDLASALQQFRAEAQAHHGSVLISATVSLVQVGANSQFLVTGKIVDAFRPDPVAILIDKNLALLAPQSTDPVWKQMAERTTAKAQLDQIKRWLTSRGYADAIGLVKEHVVGAPVMGALVIDASSKLIGLDSSDGASSILYGLVRCGAVMPEVIGRGESSVDYRHARAAWWISPDFETHPVRNIGEASLAVTPGYHPPFLTQGTPL